MISMTLPDLTDRPTVTSVHADNFLGVFLKHFFLRIKNGVFAPGKGEVLLYFSLYRFVEFVKWIFKQSAHRMWLEIIFFGNLTISFTSECILCRDFVSYLEL